MTGSEVFMFWLLALVTLAGGLSVILVTNPIMSALSLTIAMLGIGGLFVTLNAYFIAAVQVTVYAGAVMVLFLMVLMLFNLKTETRAFTKGTITGFVKIASAALFCGLIVGASYMTADIWLESSKVVPEEEVTQTLANLLFSKYMFGFQAMGVLLLVVAVGSVALARSKGGTHAKS